MQDLKINLGCGLEKLEGFIGVDFRAELHPTICADIRRPIPSLPDGCAAVVRCSHVMEHLPGEDYHPALCEMARLLRPGGVFEIRVPHPSAECAMVHGHIHILTPRWWRQMKTDNWLHGRLSIDDIEEIPDEHAIADGFFASVPENRRRYYFNMYMETVVRGHKPLM